MKVDYSALQDQIDANKKYISTKNVTAIVTKDIIPLSLTKSDTDVTVSVTPKKDTKKSIPVTEVASKSTTNDIDISFDATPTLDNITLDISKADKINNPLTTSIDFINGMANNAASAVQGVVNAVTAFQNGFNNTTSTVSSIDNQALISLKSDVKKTVDTTVTAAIPYTTDEAIKQFQQGDTLNSIISGVISTVSSIAGLANSFYDTDELIEIAKASFTQMNNDGNLFSGSGVLGYNKKIGGSKPAIKIKQVASDGSYETFKTGVPDFSGDTRNIGYLYVRPFQNNISIEPFQIPFEMNAKITEDTIQANYNSEQMLNRVGEMKTFINTGASNLSLETTYVILSDGNASGGNNTIMSSWMDDWTQSYVKAIENAYRSLVYSTYNENINNSSDSTKEAYVNGILKPPVIRIVLNSSTNIPMTVSELYTYPQAKVSSTEYGTNDTSKTLYNLSKDDTMAAAYKWYKAYVATGVNISIEDDMGINTGTKSMFYTGFKVQLTLAEVTENYLDCIPDFKSYYDSFSNILV